MIVGPGATSHAARPYSCRKYGYPLASLAIKVVAASSHWTPSVFAGSVSTRRESAASRCSIVRYSNMRSAYVAAVDNTPGREGRPAPMT